jgi:ketosteroid isomerase-like protein
MSEQSIEFVKGVYGAFARGDVPAVLGAFADDIEWYEAEGMPYGGLHHGGEAVAQKVFGPIAEDVEGFAVSHNHRPVEQRTLLPCQEASLHHSC